MSQGEYSVCQFFEDGSHEYVQRYVSVQEAVEAAEHYCHSVAAQMGITQRVIITDNGDCITFEWKYGKGVIFPPKGEDK